jgi:hypothetical protein
MALDTVRKISFKPTSRRSSHLRTSQGRVAPHWTRDRALQSICPGDTGFRHLQSASPGGHFSKKTVRPIALKRSPVVPGGSAPGAPRQSLAPLSDVCAGALPPST